MSQYSRPLAVFVGAPVTFVGPAVVAFWAKARVTIDDQSYGEHDDYSFHNVPFLSLRNKICNKICEPISIDAAIILPTLR